jgi:hypothetical protein
MEGALPMLYAGNVKQWRLVRVGKVGTAYPDFAKDINLFKLKFINKYNLITLKCNF